MAILRRIEFFFYALFQESGQMAALFAQTLTELPSVFRGARRTLGCMMEFGFNTLPLAAFIGVFIGMADVAGIRRIKSLRRRGHRRAV